LASSHFADGLTNFFQISEIWAAPLRAPENARKE